MQNPNDDSYNYDDEEFDDILEDSFEDDFDEIEDVYEDEFIAPDDFDDPENYDVTEESFTEKPAKSEGKSGKKINLSFNTVVILGAVIVGLIVLVVQVVSNRPTQTTDDKFRSAIQMSGSSDGYILGDETTSVDENSSGADPVEQNNNNGTSQLEQSEGFLFEPEVLDSVEVNLEKSESDVSKLADENANIEDSVPNIEDIFVNNKESELSDIPRAPEDNTSAADEIITLDVIDETPVIETPKPQKTIIPENPIPVVTEKNEPMATEPANNAGIDEKNNTQVVEMQQKLDLMTKQLEQMQSEMNKLESEKESQVAEMEKTIDSLKKEIQSLKAKPKQAAIQKPSSETPKTNNIASAPSPSWELRAAQPGKAWVSEKGNTQLRPVIVGDNLPGIGIIQAINFSGGKWLVKGSNGEIRQ